MKVSPDKQTLILAGEPIPSPRGSSGGAPAGRSEVGLQLLTVLLVQGDYAAATLAANAGVVKSLAAPSERVLLPAAGVAASAPRDQALVPYASSHRALSAGAAEYARTQNLSDRTRSQIIDTYA